MRDSLRTPTEARVRLLRLPGSGDGAKEPPPALVDALVVAHDQLADAYWLLTLSAPVIAENAKPGQFLMLTVAGDGESAPVLPRPMAIYAFDREAGTVQVLYRTVGAGTRAMTAFRPGDRMTTVGPLGQGFTLMPGTRSILLLGRGIGTCSLTALSAVAAEQSITIHAVVSARNRELLVGGDFYRQVGAVSVLEVTDTDGSSSVESLRPRLRALLREDPVQQIFVCGSNRLLVLAAQLGDAVRAGVQVSLEAHMACGLGYCHGCSSGYPGMGEEAPLVCKDGPVFAYAGAVV